MAFNAQAGGVYAIAVTPFLPDGRVDEASVDRMVGWYEEVGVDGLTILGILGEAPKLDQDEALAFARRVIERTRLPVVVGVSAPGFAAMGSLARGVMDMGAAGVMIGSPPHLRTDDQIVGYFAQASEAVAAPWVLQDYPLTLTVQMTPGVIRRIVQDNPSCVMLKHEDWPGLEKISALRRFEAEGQMRHVSILCGNGGLFLDFETERGADGAMTGFAYPEMLVELVRLAKAGKRDEAHDLFDAHLPLLRYEQQPGVGLAVRKHILMKRGVIAYDAQRKPASALTDKAREETDYLMSRLAARLAP